MSGNRSFPAKSVYKETTIKNGDSQISTSVDIGPRLDCLHRHNRCLPNVPIHPQSRKYLRFMFESQVFQFAVLPSRMALSPWIFSKLMDVIALHMCQHPIPVFPYLDDWLIRDLIRNRLISHTKYCLQTIQSLGFIPKSKEVRFETSPEIHNYRDGISDATENSQGTTGPSRFPTSDY